MLGAFTIMEVLFILFAAAAPTALYTLLLWWLDRYEKEPLHLLAITFLWGAAPALALAIGAELAAGGLIASVFGPGSEATLVAPVVEESLKALALLGLFVFARREFDGVLDGIIYGALVGLGFSMSENVLYLVAYNDQFMATWWLRTGLFGFNHAFFSSIVGIGFGLVRYERRRSTKVLTVLGALGLAIAAHMLHNTAVQGGVLGLSIAWLANSGGVLIIVATALLSLQHEINWITTELREEVDDGLISLQQFSEVSHPTLRSRAELHTLVRNGWLPYRRLRRFHHLLTELAFVKYQLGRQDRFCCADDVAALRIAIQGVGRMIAEEHKQQTVISRVEQ